MKDNGTPIATHRDSPTGTTVQRRELASAAYSKDERESIIDYFQFRGYDVARIAAYCRRREIPSGHSEIQKVIRQRLLESTGRRREDIAARRAS